MEPGYELATLGVLALLPAKTGDHCGGCGRDGRIFGKTKGVWILWIEQKNRD